MTPHINATHSIEYARRQLLNAGRELFVERWQAMKAPQPMWEVFDVDLKFGLPLDIKVFGDQVKPNLPWADVHFDERVSGKPLNPGESWKIWPYNKMAAESLRNAQFSHTYMERIWPKFSRYNTGTDDTLKEAMVYHGRPLHGIRYDYGDLQDVVNLLAKDPTTRQAYLPIWFPEDTGAVHGERVPCTLGYQFFMRDGFLHLTYYIRSCDFIRHFRDDIYLAGRLVYWMLDQLREHGTGVWKDIHPGYLRMHIDNLHCFKSDLKLIEDKFNEPTITK